jgi:TRAP-type C4-dicarboxylate transport system permease small subunit
MTRALRLASGLRRGVAGVAAQLARLAGWVYVGCAGLITFDIVARNLFGFSSKATVELSGYMLAGGIAFALAHALAMRAHIRVDVFVTRLPVKVRAALHLVAMVLLTGFGAFAAWAALELVDESLLFDAHDTTALRIPMVIPQGAWALGICVFVVMCAVLLLESLLALLAGDAARLDGLLASRTLQDETEEALQAVAQAEKKA